MTAADISESGQPSCQQGETVSAGEVWQSKKSGKEMARTARCWGMMRTIGISLVGALMAAQLIFLLYRNPSIINEKDYPAMQLPVAKYSKRHCSSVYYENISWTQKGGWTVYGVGKVKDEDLDQFLKSEVERHNQKGNLPGMRVRIPANAPAGVFVDLTKRMEKAGVVQVRVAVVEQNYPMF
jgi:hypothetical protein